MHPRGRLTRFPAARPGLLGGWSSTIVYGSWLISCSPICIGPLVGPLMPEPAHTVGDDPPQTLDQASTVAHKTQSRSEGEGTTARPDNTDLDMEDDDILTLNTCGHSFHSKCLSSWFLIERHDCPVCRTAYYKGGGGPRRERTLAVPPFF